MSTELPSWDQLTDLDKGAALMHALKRETEGAEYANENYPADFFDDPVLLALDRAEAGDYAEAAVEAYKMSDTYDLSDELRWYDLALAADNARLDAQVTAMRQARSTG